ncbi:hypothetical protein ABIB51_002734 [Arthrobacter sp. UYCu712]
MRHSPQSSDFWILPKRDLYLVRREYLSVVVLDGEPCITHLILFLSNRSCRFNAFCNGVAQVHDASGVTWSCKRENFHTYDPVSRVLEKVWAELPRIKTILPTASFTCTAMAMHNVVALALPEVVAFDLAIPAQVFGHVDERERYSFKVCAAEPGLVPTTTGYAIQVTHGLDVLHTAGTVVVPGFSPLDDPPEKVSIALRQARRRGVRIVSVCTGRVRSGSRRAPGWEARHNSLAGCRTAGRTVSVDDGRC